MKRYRALAVMLLIVAVAALAAPSVSQAAPQHQTFSASLTPVGGLVQYLPSGKSEWQTINQVTLINEGDQIRTGEGGIAKLNVVTGTQVDIFPNSAVQLNALSMGSNGSGMTFNLLQLQGFTEVTVSQTIKAGDSLSVSTPTFTANIRGTKFKTGVGADGSAIAFTDEGTIVLLGADGKQIEVGPGAFAVASFDPNNSSATTTSFKDAGAQDLLKGWLKSFLSSNSSPLVNGFIAALIGADAGASTADLLAALDGATLNFDSFKSAFGTFTDAWAAQASKNELAPVTCGNGAQDTGETSANCPEDFADQSGKGDKICSADKGESIINDPEDCAPLANLLSSAALLNAGKTNQGGGGNGNPNPGNNPPDTTGNGTGQGNGGGVGRNPGGIVFFSTTGGAQCTVTTTADVNLRSTTDGSVVGAAPAGSTFTVVGTNNNGWVTDGNVSIARNFTTASAGCPQ